MRILVRTIVCGALLASCTRHTWTPGPSAQIKDFEMQRAQCRLMARHAGSEFYAAGSPGFVAGASIGHGIGEGIRTQADFNDCMAASGWKVAD